MPGDEVNPGIGEEFLVLRRDLGRELGTAQDRVGCDEADLAALLNEGGGELGAGVGGGGEIGLAPDELGIGPQLLAEGRAGVRRINVGAEDGDRPVLVNLADAVGG